MAASSHFYGTINGLVIKINLYHNIESLLKQKYPQNASFAPNGYLIRPDYSS